MFNILPLQVLAVCPKSLHMVKPTIVLTHRVIHTLLSCERHAGERSMIDTLLIVMQTLSSVEDILSQLYSFRNLLKSPSQSSYSAGAGIEVTNISVLSVSRVVTHTFQSNTAVCQRLKKLWICLYVNSVKVYTHLGDKKHGRSYQKLVSVMNTLQTRLQKLGYDFNLKKKRKITRSDRLYLTGLYLTAIENWKREIIDNVSHKKDLKKVGKWLHSILYSYLLHRDFCGVSSFLSWLYTLLKSVLYPEKCGIAVNNSIFSDDNVKKSISAVASKKSDKQLTQTERQADREETVSRGKNANREESEVWEPPHSSSRNSHHNASRSRVLNPTDSDSQIISKLVKATRQVIGTLGRIIAKVILQQDIHLPSPHRPHLCDALWILTRSVRGKFTTLM